MLAQRRARLLRQIDLLERQRHGADAGFQALEQRMATLSRQMLPPAPEARPAPSAPPEAGPLTLPAAAAEPRPAPAAARRRGMLLEY
ncbi:hypothetical protein [Teichococcus aestuarii]|uniref:hypothetical protein n=1 Tax=Teichococcus aestuarii TaxID=568898 RepID=UPI00361231FE